MRIVVAHPLQQHSYRLATALKRKGILYKYITPVYNKKFSWTKLLVFFLPAKHKAAAAARVCESLDDSDVLLYCELEGLLRLFSQNVKAFRKYHEWIKYHLSDRFANKVAKYVIKNKIDVVICYDDCSSKLFTILKEKAPHVKCILDVSAANRFFMREIYNRDIDLAPRFSKRLKTEVARVWNEELMERFKMEIDLADFFLVPSEFVARSLKYSGITSSKMLICPYGVDIDMFKQKHDYKSELPLKFIYVGGIKELKGIYYLLEAFKKIPREFAELIIVGNYDDNEDVKPYLEYVTFTGKVLHSEIPRLLKDSDIFVMPSLGEGLSLSCLEAAACGLPLMVSENSGINSYIQEYKEGIVFPIQSVQKIIDSVMWFVENKEKIEDMGNEARRLAELFSWEKYYEVAYNAISSIS